MVINSISIEKILWIQFSEDRVSFSYEGLPDGSHFTISWKNDNNINLHITKNTGDENDKPKIIIASWNKELANKIIPYIPSLIIGKLFEPVSFKIYPRKSRKNIRLIYFDELERQKDVGFLEESMTNIFKQNSSIERKKLKIKSTIEEYFIPLANSRPMKNLLLNNLRPLTVRSFASKFFRSGIIFMGNKSFLFISYNNKCFILKKRKTIQKLLSFFIKPELVDELTSEINRALAQIQDANTFDDTRQHHRLYKLFIDSDN